MSGSVSLAATIRRGALRVFLVILVFVSLRSIAMLVIPSEARDLSQRAASHKQNLSNASPTVRSFAVCAAQDDPLETLSSFALLVAFAKSNAAAQVIQAWMQSGHSCRR